MYVVKTYIWSSIAKIARVTENQKADSRYFLLSKSLSKLCGENNVNGKISCIFVICMLLKTIYMKNDRFI